MNCSGIEKEVIEDKENSEEGNQQTQEDEKRCNKMTDFEAAQSKESVTTVDIRIEQPPSQNEITLSHECFSDDSRVDSASDQLFETDISSCQLYAFPDTLLKHTSLRIIKAQFNYITTLPRSFTTFTVLTELELSYNRFREIPRMLAQLTNLRALVMVGNSISTVPDELLALKSLQVLRLGLNAFRVFPTILLKLPSLITLHMNNNQIERFDSFKIEPESSQLTALNLERNKIKEIPEKIDFLSSLRQLNLNENKITILPRALGWLPSLKILTLRSNEIETIPSSLSSLVNLTSLDLSMNKLTKLPPLWFEEGNTFSLSPPAFARNGSTEAAGARGDFRSKSKSSSQERRTRTRSISASPELVTKALIYFISF
jgi:Leucine-rich repeat (LRR) protein